MNKHSAVVLSELTNGVVDRYDRAGLTQYPNLSEERRREVRRLGYPALREISAASYTNIRDLSVKAILDICDDLLASHRRYMDFFAFDIADRIKKRLSPGDFPRLERWVKRYVTGWDSCDHLCTRPLGHLILQHQELAPRVFQWTRSRNQWVRRASAVAPIVSVRRGFLLEQVFLTADALLLDREDLVQRGYGWMLKEATKHFPDEIFAFVMDRRLVMPRTALRYAIEKLPMRMKKEAMAR